MKSSSVRGLATELELPEITSSDFFEGSNLAIDMAAYAFISGTIKIPSEIVVTTPRILVIDTSNHRVQIFDHSGNYSGQLDSMV